ncbi:hypothetical protein IMZ48_32700, partial [Candidatus Bathyarchaeota archaeon]|nr:hypothetical protein [Candidatus Bathyarchaeota archaeon]
MYDAILDSQSPDPVKNITIGGITSKMYFKYKFSVYKGAHEAMKYYALELVQLMDRDRERAEEWRASRIYQDLSSTYRMKPQELQLLTPAKIETSLVQRNAQPFKARRKDPIPEKPEKPGKTPPAGKSALDAQHRQKRPTGVGGLRLAATVSKKRFQGDHDDAARRRPPT